MEEMRYKIQVKKENNADWIVIKTTDNAYGAAAYVELLEDYNKKIGIVGWKVRAYDPEHPAEIYEMQNNEFSWKIDCSMPKENCNGL